LNYRSTRDNRNTTEAGMQQARRIRLDGRRSGAVIVVVAITLVLIVGMAAFAIDTGMLLSARADAQRAADAAALASLTAFLDAPYSTRAEVAEQRGTLYATRNQLLHEDITDSEVSIVLVSSTMQSLRVRATVRRDAVPTFFAGIWGIKTLPVSALAEAEVARTGKVDCVKPLGLPSDYLDAFGTYQEITAYQAKNDTLVILNLNPKEQPGVGDVWKQFTAECDDVIIALEDLLLWEKPGSGKDKDGEPKNNSGEGWGQVKKGVEELIDEDPTLKWDAVKGFTRNNKPVDDWASSPRVANIILYDRDEFVSGVNQLKVMDFARVFFHRTVGNGVNNFEVKVVLLPAQGVVSECVGEECATNAYTIRLVK
jgi:hypothetical protein